MGHKNKISLRQQVYDELQKKNGFGRSKHKDKALGVSDQFIYSFSTMKTYMKHCHYFVEFCKNDIEIKNELGHKPRTLKECEKFVEKFIRHNEKRGLSSYTVKMQKSALEKMYGEKFDFKTKSSKRSDIKRSRHDAKRDGHFSEKLNEDFVNCCRHVGFRRFEFEKCKATDLFVENGQYYVKIVGKGGRERNAMVLNNDQKTIDYIKNLNGHNKAPNGADIHSYRGDYATELYKLYAHDITVLKGQKINYTDITGKRKNGREIFKSALYVCRNDKSGATYDRTAMLIVSQNLGHNRESVVADHYLYKL